MTVSGPAQTDVWDYIRRILETLAVENRVKLLFGIESGSRAWGFPSADSDYDVRFVYRCPVDDYLSVADRRDVIDTPTAHDEVLGVELDLNDWDIRKALQLALKSNAALLEWLDSPVCYAKDEELYGLLQGFANKAADLQALSYHYDRLARRAWEEILAGSTQVKLKRYCYALRSALALAWIGKNQTVPPMTIRQLMEGQSLSEQFRGEIDRMIEIKSGSTEKDAV
ncbi:MAG: nucleotidyltransferase domain-containing protein, partial [Candidatus Methylumidiphilus sp.]